MLYEELLANKKTLSVIGMGYVGMPISVAFAKKINVIGYDINDEKILLYQRGIDPTKEVGDDEIQKSKVKFTSCETDLREASFHIVAVPTPINSDKTPDLSPVIGACTILGRNLNKGSIVVFESTVYPGVTEDVCIPILEKESGLKCGFDFKVGYSPERINPGDQAHRLNNICKIVSGMDEETRNEIQKVYEFVVEKTYAVSSIKVAEAIKVAENSQRDINIAFMNELAMAFDRMGIDTNEVVDGMNTKWNALGFRPGLVGGHCIGVDPYYFIYEAENLGYHSQIISAGRKVNDGMGDFVAEAAIREMVLAGKAPKDSKVAILGMTFKENCPDTRNSKVIDIIRRLQEFGVHPMVVDPWLQEGTKVENYDYHISSIEKLHDLDCIIVAVAHDEFKQLPLEMLMTWFKAGNNSQNVLIDVKGIYRTMKPVMKSVRYWSL